MPRKPSAAVSSHASSARTRLDHFIYAKLTEKGIAPSPQADDRTLIRRAYIDLVGLKPTYEEVEAYASDTSPDKYEKLVAELIAAKKSDAAILESLTLATLGRLPTDSEKKLTLASIGSAKDRKSAWVAIAKALAGDGKAEPKR